MGTETCDTFVLMNTVKYVSDLAQLRSETPILYITSGVTT